MTKNGDQLNAGIYR